MNSWVKKSIEIANKPGYLDSLHEIYPMEQGAFRELPTDVLNKIRKFLDKRDSKGLVGVLLHKVDLFPIKDSYVAYLRKSEYAINNNPNTIKRISDRLFKMGFEEIVRNSTQPKETNRQIGPMFRNWLSSLGYPILDKEDFLTSDSTCFLNGSDKTLKKFAEENLGIKLNKGLDLILKVKGNYILGEAKFLTDFGGHQNAQFSDPFNLSNGRSKVKVMKIGVLDGVVWLKTRNKMHLLVKSSKGVFFSALLLREFIEFLEKEL